MRKIDFTIVLTISLSLFMSSCFDFDGDGDGIEIDERAPSTERGLVIRSLSNTIDLNTEGTFRVALQTNPGKDVTITVNHTELSGNSTISPAAFILNSSNWLEGYPITISGVCDTLPDNATYSIDFSASGGYPSTFGYADSSFTDGDNSSMERGTKANGDYADNLTGVIYEADKIGVRASQGFTTESSGNSTLYISLCKQPANNVTVQLSSSNSSEGQPSTQSVVFSSGNWSTEVPVNILGQDDNDTDGNTSYNIEVAAVGYPTETLALTNIDNETPQIITSVSSISAIQEGSTGTLTASLSSPPNANVVIPISVRDAPTGSSSSHVTVSPSSLTFSSGNYSTAQTITISATSDNNSEGLMNYYLYLGPANTSDSNYSSLPAKALIGQVYD